MDDNWVATPLTFMIHCQYFAVGTGLITHLILNHGEWDHTTHILLSCWLIGFLTITGITTFLGPTPVSPSDAFHICTVLALTYFTTLLCSILIYRAFFHRLRKVCSPISPQHETPPHCPSSRAPSQRASQNSTPSPTSGKQTTNTTKPSSPSTNTTTPTSSASGHENSASPA